MTGTPDPDDGRTAVSEEDRSTRTAVATMHRLVAGHRRTVAVATVPALAGAALGPAQPLVAKHVVDASGRGQAVRPLPALLGTLSVTEAATGAAGRHEDLPAGSALYREPAASRTLRPGGGPGRGSRAGTPG